VLKVSEILPCSETDTLIHERVYMLAGEPWPYSSNDTLAKRIAETFDIFVVPIYDRTTLRSVIGAGTFYGTVCGYFGLQMVEPEEEVSLSGRSLTSLAPADTYALAVVRSALLVLGLAEDDVGSC
jgi:hypothetical protein